MFVRNQVRHILLSNTCRRTSCRTPVDASHVRRPSLFAGVFGWEAKQKHFVFLVVFRTKEAKVRYRPHTFVRAFSRNARTTTETPKTPQKKTQSSAKNRAKATANTGKTPVNVRERPPTPPKIIAKAGPIPRKSRPDSPTTSWRSTCRYDTSKKQKMEPTRYQQVVLFCSCIIIHLLVPSTPSPKKSN